MKMFAPQPSTDNEGHYCTFLEMCSKHKDELSIGDNGMPSAADSNLGNCPSCPSFTFLSKTEKERHIKVFHPSMSNSKVRQKNSKQKVNTSTSAMFTCNFKVDGCVECGLCFDSRYKLAKHRRLVGHQVLRASKKTSMHAGCEYLTNVEEFLSARDEAVDMFDGLDDEQEEDEIEADEQEEDEDSEQEDDEQEENEDDNSEHEIEEEMDSKGKEIHV